MIFRTYTYEVVYVPSDGKYQIVKSNGGGMSKEEAEAERNRLNATLDLHPSSPPEKKKRRDSTGNT